jgi:hypothetical protein
MPEAAELTWRPRGGHRLSQAKTSVAKCRSPARAAALRPTDDSSKAFGHGVGAVAPPMIL